MKFPFSFTILQKDKKSKARIGKLTTPHGIVDTPAFVPVGTQASVKSLTSEDLSDIGVQILFGNTYHLHLRPGEDVVESFGGLGKFMGFGGVTMTDSGGFQVFSLAKNSNRQRLSYIAGEQVLADKPALVTIAENGVEFRSHLDGSKHFFTPETSIAIQKKLGADIILAFDDCPPFPITYEGAKKAMERTHRWLTRSLAAFNMPSAISHQQALYGIVQGSVFEDLRKISATFVGNVPVDGFAIGGVAVGEGKESMRDAVLWSVPLLPEEKIRHLLGVGEVDDVFDAVALGIDTFDCVTPTRLGRVGGIFVNIPEGNRENRFRIDITKSEYALSSMPLALDCACFVCRKYTRGYIHHLFRSHELLAYRLATYHNVYFIINLFTEIRKAIATGTFMQLKDHWLSV